MNHKALGYSVVGLGILANPAHAVNFASTTCANCTTLAQLRDAVQAWRNANYVPNGTIVLVTSLNAPLSAFIQIRAQARSAPAAVAITASTVAANQLDEQILARSAKITVPVKAPFDYPALDSSVSLEVERVMLFSATGDTGIAYYHWLNSLTGEPGFPYISYWTYYIPSLSLTTQIFVGDLVTITFTNGFQVKAQFQGADKTPANRWKMLPNTLMLDGKPYVPPAPAPATTSGGGGAGGGNIWGKGGSIWNDWTTGTCSGVSSMTITDSYGNSYTGFSSWTYSC